MGKSKKGTGRNSFYRFHGIVTGFVEYTFMYHRNAIGKMREPYFHHASNQC